MTKGRDNIKIDYMEKGRYNFKIQYVTKGQENIKIEYMAKLSGFTFVTIVTALSLALPMLITNNCFSLNEV